VGEKDSIRYNRHGESAVFSIIDLTDGWLTDWSKDGGRFKEWVRGLELEAINHGWVHSIAKEPGLWVDRVRHVASWLPVLWNDYDFDHAYLYRMMQVKVRRMRVRHETARLIGDWAIVAGQLREVEDALGRLIEDDRHSKMWDEHDAKFGDLDSRRKEVKNPDGTVSWVFEDKPGEHESRNRIYDAEEASRVADLNLVAKNFVENSRTWWDVVILCLFIGTSTWMA